GDAREEDCRGAERHHAARGDEARSARRGGRAVPEGRRAQSVLRAVRDPMSAPNVQIYDFQRPHRVSRERMRTLEAMYGRLVKSFEGWLIGRVRSVVDLRLNSVEQISFGEYVLSLPASCNSFLLDIKDRAGDDAV